MNITIGKGYDSIVFGLTEKQVIEQLGQPDKIYDVEYNEDENDICFEYHALQMALNFSPSENNRLIWIAIKDRNCKINDEYLWSNDKSDIIQIFKEKLQTQHVFDDYGSLESIGFDDHGLEFQFTLGRLISINIGCMIDDDGEYIWV